MKCGQKSSFLTRMQLRKWHYSEQTLKPYRCLAILWRLVCLPDHNHQDFRGCLGKMSVPAVLWFSATNQGTIIKISTVWSVESQYSACKRLMNHHTLANPCSCLSSSDNLMKSLFTYEACMNHKCPWSCIVDDSLCFIADEVGQNDT